VERLNNAQADKAIAGRENVIFAFWHGTMLCPWYQLRNNGMLALISSSKDGELLARTLKFWKYKVVRGSSSKGGSSALDTMVEYAANEGSVCLTPDGPRGPAHEFKAGAVVAAKKSGAPLVLIGAAYEKKWKLKSWDAFEIPKLFSRVRLVYSEPIKIDGTIDRDTTSMMIKNCEQQLRQLQIEAEKFNG
jgi:lysophospholipid acyltransferase (LPLAT)-like uncharacterized protein